MVDFANLETKLCGEVRGTLLTDSQDIEAVLCGHGFSDEIDDCTGLIVKLAPCGTEYSAIWLTQASRPFDNSALYSKLELAS